MKSLSPVFNDRPELAELYIALLDNYYGIGSTPRNALESVADDLKHGRLTSDEALDTLNCTRDEMIVTVSYVVEHFAQWAADAPVSGMRGA